MVFKVFPDLTISWSPCKTISANLTSSSVLISALILPAYTSNIISALLSFLLSFTLVKTVIFPLALFNSYIILDNSALVDG